MRLMSVALTEDQVRARTKTVTRRLGWRNLQPATRLCLVRKAMGRKRRDGSVEPLVRLAVVDVRSVRREPLWNITDDDVAREGFHDWDKFEFIDFFCRSMRCRPQDEVARIEWRYNELEFIRVAAGEVYRPDGVEIWLGARNQLLGGHSPADCVAAGEWRRVHGLIQALGEGVVL